MNNKKPINPELFVWVNKDKIKEKIDFRDLLLQYNKDNNLTKVENPLLFLNNEKITKEEIIYNVKILLHYNVDLKKINIEDEIKDKLNSFDENLYEKLISEDIKNKEIVYKKIDYPNYKNNIIKNDSCQENININNFYKYLNIISFNDCKNFIEQLNEDELKTMFKNNNVLFLSSLNKEIEVFKFLFNIVKKNNININNEIFGKTQNSINTNDKKIYIFKNQSLFEFNLSIFNFEICKFLEENNLNKTILKPLELGGILSYDLLNIVKYNKKEQMFLYKNIISLFSNEDIFLNIFFSNNKINKKSHIKKEYFNKNNSYGMLNLNYNIDNLNNFLYETENSYNLNFFKTIKFKDKDTAVLVLVNYILSSIILNLDILFKHSLQEKLIEEVFDDFIFLKNKYNNLHYIFDNTFFKMNLKMLLSNKITKIYNEKTQIISQQNILIEKRLLEKNIKIKTKLNNNNRNKI